MPATPDFPAFATMSLMVCSSISIASPGRGAPAASSQAAIASVVAVAPVAADDAVADTAGGAAAGAGSAAPHPETDIMTIIAVRIGARRMRAP